MKNTLIILLLLFAILTTGFVVIDYNQYHEPTWVYREYKQSGYLPQPHLIKPKVEKAIGNINKKGLQMDNVKIYISPYRYGVVKGISFSHTYEIIIATHNTGTIYHELGHMYEYKNKGLLEKYAKDMQNHYPNVEIKNSPFEVWEEDISEDFAEEFRVLFTGGTKKTLYPSFPNFHEWLLRNTQPIEITREEVFDKLGGTDKLIKEGVVIGNENGDYMLSKPIARGEVATVLVRLKGLTKEKQVPFTDIKNQWYSGYVKKIYNEGLIRGLPNNTFAGDKLITRYELHMILERLE